MCKQVAKSGDVVIQKRRSAIGDTRVPVSATPPDRSQISPKGLHQGARRPGLHRMESVSSFNGKLRKGRTSTLVGSLMTGLSRAFSDSDS